VHRPCLPFGTTGVDMVGAAASSAAAIAEFTSWVGLGVDVAVDGELDGDAGVPWPGERGSSDRCPPAIVYTVFSRGASLLPALRPWSPGSPPEAVPNLDPWGNRTLVSEETGRRRYARQSENHNPRPYHHGQKDADEESL